MAPPFAGGPRHMGVMDFLTSDEPDLVTLKRGGTIKSRAERFASPANAKQQVLKLKMLVVGDGGSGKTCLCKRYCAGKFESEHQPTLRVDFSQTQTTVGGKVARLTLWHSGHRPDQPREVSANHVRALAGGFIVVDGTKADALAAVGLWKAELDSRLASVGACALPVALLVNKSDLPLAAVLQQRQLLDAVCKEQRLVGWFHTSALSGTNIDLAVREVLLVSARHALTIPPVPLSALAETAVDGNDSGDEARNSFGAPKVHQLAGVTAADIVILTQDVDRLRKEAIEAATAAAAAASAAAAAAAGGTAAVIPGPSANSSSAAMDGSGAPKDSGTAIGAAEDAASGADGNSSKPAAAAAAVPPPFATFELPAGMLATPPPGARTVGRSSSLAGGGGTMRSGSQAAGLGSSGSGSSAAGAAAAAAVGGKIGAKSPSSKRRGSLADSSKTQGAEPAAALDNGAPANAAASGGGGGGCCVVS